MLYVQKLHDTFIGAESLMSHPPKQDHLVRQALESAARVGPAGAITSLEKAIEREQTCINHLRAIVAKDDAVKGFGVERRSESFLVSAPIKEQTPWDVVKALITEFAQTSGIQEEATKDILQALHKQHLRTPDSLHALSGSEFTVVGLPVGFRVWLQNRKGTDRSSDRSLKAPQDEGWNRQFSGSAFASENEPNTPSSTGGGDFSPIGPTYPRSESPA